MFINDNNFFKKKAYTAFKFFSSNYKPMSKEYRNLFIKKIKMSEKISVLMTSYNASNFIKDSIKKYIEAILQKLGVSNC